MKKVRGHALLTRKVPTGYLAFCACGYEHYGVFDTSWDVRHECWALHYRHLEWVAGSDALILRAS